MSGTLQILWLYLIYAVPAFLACALIWFFGRRRVQWFKWEFLILVIPWFLYYVSLAIKRPPSQNVGYIFFPFLFGLTTAIVPLLRLVIGNRFNQKKVAIVALSAFCLFVFLIPFIPAFDPGPWKDR